MNDRHLTHDRLVALTRDTANRSREHLSAIFKHHILLKLHFDAATESIKESMELIARVDELVTKNCRGSRAPVRETPSARPALLASKPLMLQNLAAEIIHCYERARQAREKAELAANDEFKADFLEAEGRWLALAHSYGRQHALSRTVIEFDRRRNAGAITRVLREQRGVFEPDVIAWLDIAYHTVLDRLGLPDREDGATLVVAKRIIDLATQGERDPERLTAATIEALSK
jgi:hypothetical protein